MSKMILILGGARSGKSSYAVDLAKKMKRKAVFVATATAWDDEMKERIRLHKISRPKNWGLIEEPVNLSKALLKLKPVYNVAVIDCLGLWVSNLLMEDMKEKVVKNKVKELISVIGNAGADLVIVVSNEVGCGIVPGDPLSRKFRDLVGLANQLVAEKASEVVFMQAGIPVKIKQDPSISRPRDKTKKEGVR